MAKCDMDISELLKEKGPLLSSDVANILQRQLGIKPEAARKRIERGKTAGNFKSIEHLKFRRNERFLYLPEHAGTSRLILALKDGLSKTESPMYDSLMAIQARGGLVLQTAFPTISGLPIMTGGKDPG